MQGLTVYATAATSENCRLPLIPRNGFITYESNRTFHLKESEIVPNYSQIRYGCIENHYIIGGDSSSICLSGKWSNAAALQCEPRCAISDISSVTYTTTCYKTNHSERTSVRCGPTDLVEPGVSVRIACKIGYQSTTAIQQQTTCEPKGQWNRRINPCQQICGEEGPQGSIYVVGGHITNNSMVPWHVGIYRDGPKMDNELDYVCGGTIVNPRLVISAVHCFWDGIFSKINPADEYHVVAGKFFRQFSDPRERNQFQTVNVQRIEYPDGYLHYDGQFANDIALLILATGIEYRPHIAPACINFNYGFEELTVKPGKYGRVAGWGLTESSGELSSQLKMIELPVVDRDECKKNLDRPTRPFLTSDKYCAGALNLNVGVCQGDSGGGLLFRDTDTDGSERFYLRGIVSAGANLHGSCDSNKYAFFVNTAHYSKFIEHFDAQTNPAYVDYDASWVPKAGSCKISSIPDNGFVCQAGNLDRHLMINDQIENGGVIEYHCNDGSGLELQGAINSTCQYGRWSDESERKCVKSGEATCVYS